MLRKLRYFAEQISKAELVVLPRVSRDAPPLELDELEAKLDEQERELLEVSGNVEKLRRSHRRVVFALVHVLSRRRSLPGRDDTPRGRRARVFAPLRGPTHHILQ